MPHRDNIGSTIASNLSTLRDRRSACEELRQMTLLQFIAHACARSDAKSVSSASKIYRAACALDGALTCAEKVLVCKSIAAQPHFSYKLADILLDSIEDIPQSARRNVIYVKNRQSDDAFLGFSKLISRARASYAGTFSECCEAVFDAKCEFCLLPIENTEVGKLQSFYSLLDKYELKICHTLQINKDDSHGVTYALAAKSILPTNVGKDVRFEFNVVRESGEYIGDILTALTELGCGIYALGTDPVEYDHLKQKCFFSVDVPADALAPLLLYLELEYPRFSSIGLYKTDKEN